MSAADEILVTFGSIAMARDDVAQTANSLNTQLGDLKQFLAPMVATWTGAAAANYHAKQQQWDNAAADLNLILAQIGQRLGGAHDDFQATEARATQIWA